MVNSCHKLIPRLSQALTGAKGDDLIADNRFNQLVQEGQWTLALRRLQDLSISIEGNYYDQTKAKHWLDRFVKIHQQFEAEERLINLLQS